MEFYIVQFNDAEKCQPVQVEHLSFKNKTLKVVLQGHREEFLICCTERPDKGRFTYVQWKLTCSESMLKCSESLQVPVRPCFTAPSFYRNRWQQHPRTSNSKRRELDETICQGLDEKKIWLKKSATDFLLICLDVSLGTQRGSQTTVQPVELWQGLLALCPTVPRAAQHDGRGTACAAGDTCLGSTGAPASGFSGTLNLALYLPVPLNFISKTKAIIFPTLHS